MVGSSGGGTALVTGLAAAPADALAVGGSEGPSSIGTQLPLPSGHRTRAGIQSEGLGLRRPPDTAIVQCGQELSSRLTFLVTWCRRGLQPKAYVIHRGCASSRSSNVPAHSNVISMGSRSTGQYSDHQSLLLLARRHPLFFSHRLRFLQPESAVSTFRSFAWHVHPQQQGRSAATELHSRHSAAAYGARERFIARRRRAKASAASSQGTA